MLKPVDVTHVSTSCYVERARMPTPPTGWAWDRGHRHGWLYGFYEGRRRLWVHCHENGRLTAGFMGLAEGYPLSLTEEKEQIMQLLTKYRILSDATIG
jgi:hypothetical protein